MPLDEEMLIISQPTTYYENYRLVCLENMSCSSRSERESWHVQWKFLGKWYYCRNWFHLIHNNMWELPLLKFSSKQKAGEWVFNKHINKPFKQKYRIKEISRVDYEDEENEKEVWRKEYREKLKRQAEMGTGG